MRPNMLAHPAVFLEAHLAVGVAANVDLVDPQGVRVDGILD